jgi:putative endonuclease
MTNKKQIPSLRDDKSFDDVNVRDMQKEYQFFVYILASRSRVLYVGVTNNLRFRLEQHRSGVHDGFTKRYKVNRLVYFERFKYIDKAIAREKELKDWRRELKVALIEERNPAWADLSEIEE